MSNHESGLEVVPDHGPVVVPHELESIPTALDSWRAVHGPYEKEGHGPEADNPSGEETSEPVKGVFGARKAWKWWIAALIVVLLAIAAILGGVLGSRSTKHQAIDEANPVSDPGGGNSSSTQTLSIRNNSLLSVTGHMQDDGGWVARLVFQGTDGKLRFLDRTGPDGFWSAVTILDHVPSAPNGSFGISTYLIGGITDARYQLYYATISGQLCGQFFKNESTPLTGNGDDINSLSEFIAPNGSSIATYFPYILVQDQETGQMVWYGYKYGFPPGYFNLTGESPIVIGGLRTAMVVLPTNAWVYESINVTLTAGFFYRTPESMLEFALGEPTFRGANDSGLLKWNTTAGGFPNVSLPEWSAIGGFATARAIYSVDVDTHLLYQDGNGTVQVLSQKDGKPWEGPDTFAAFNGADMGTSIACLTMGAYSRDGGMHVSLSTNSDTSRCYFQSKGVLKEVWYDGLEWRDCGFVATGRAC